MSEGRKKEEEAVKNIDPPSSENEIIVSIPVEPDLAVLSRFRNQHLAQKTSTAKPSTIS